MGSPRIAPIWLLAAALSAPHAAGGEADGDAALPSPRELWARFERTQPPFSFEVRRDEVVPSDMVREKSLRRVEVRFTSQVVRGTGWTTRRWSSSRAAARGERRGRVVVVGQRLWDESMVFNYGDSIAARTGYPVLVVPVPGEFDGLDGEGRWIQLPRALTRETSDPVDHNYFRLAVPYIRALDVLSAVLGEKGIRAVIGGHSKRATSAYTAAAIDPDRIAGVVYMGNESDFSRAGNPAFRPINQAFTQRYVKCPVLYIGATNEDGYTMFNINRMQGILERPWTVDYIPNYRHATASRSSSWTGRCGWPTCSTGGRLRGWASCATRCRRAARTSGRAWRRRTRSSR